MAQRTTKKRIALLAGYVALLLVVAVGLTANRGGGDGLREVEATGTVNRDCRTISVDAEGWRFQTEAHTAPEDWPNGSVDGRLMFDTGAPKDDARGTFEADGLSFDVKGGKIGEAFFPIGCMVPGP